MVDCSANIDELNTLECGTGMILEMSLLLELSAWLIDIGEDTGEELIRVDCKTGTILEIVLLHELSIIFRSKDNDMEGVNKIVEAIGVTFHNINIEHFNLFENLI